MKQLHGFYVTPPLWTKEQFGLTQFVMPTVDIETIDPLPVPQNIRLGQQCEYLLKALLAHSSDYEVLLHNLQVKDGNRTIGEFDFLVRFRESIYKHIELTYKFYLIDPSISEPIHRLVGPNRGDMFFTKMEKTKNQQLPLLHSQFGLEALAKAGMTEGVIQQEVCFMAQLFLPFARSERNSIRPLNKACIIGTYLQLSIFEKEFPKNALYYIPKKYEWIINPHKEVPWDSHFATLLEINIRHINQRSPMVWMQTPNGQYQKFFVVWW